MAADRNGRENYTLIRDFMTAICLYGCLSREDFIALGISSGAAYDQCTRLLRSVVPELEGRRLGQSSRKYLHFPRQYGAARESLLTNTYLLHTIRPAELAEFLVLLQRLGRGEASQTQLAAELELRSEKEGVSKYNTARSHRMELAEWGSLNFGEKRSLLYYPLLIPCSRKWLRY